MDPTFDKLRATLDEMEQVVVRKLSSLEASPQIGSSRGEASGAQPAPGSDAASESLLVRIARYFRSGGTKT